MVIEVHHQGIQGARSKDVGVTCIGWRSWNILRTIISIDYTSSTIDQVFGPMRFDSHQ